MLTTAAPLKPQSSPMDVLAINPALTALQVIVVKWDDSLTE